jgi:hypothetical protein
MGILSRIAAMSLIVSLLGLASLGAAVSAQPLTGLTVENLSLVSVPDPPSREEIQHFFTSGQGNSVRAPKWQKQYLRRHVEWAGQVYAIKRHPASMRVELLVKVLPDSLLYDTVVVLEGNTAINEFIEKGRTVRFKGRIINGVDAMGVKEVLVLVDRPDALWLEGDQPVHYRGVIGQEAATP